MSTLLHLRANEIILTADDLEKFIVSQFNLIFRSVSKIHREIAYPYVCSLLHGHGQVKTN